MTYTARYAHLSAPPLLKVGDTVAYGDIIGVMGSSGQSEAAHLHLDVAEGEQRGAYKLEDFEKGSLKPAPVRQVNHFVDDDLFWIEPEITTFYGEPAYMRQFGKLHFGYDVVPEDRHRSREHFVIRWNRSMAGHVVRVAYDPAGYGHHVQIAFDA